MNKYKKGALIISIILLIITLPLTVMGIIYNKEIKNVENPSKLFHYNNKLYFYNELGDLIGNYECNFKNCSYAKQTIDDEDYSINYYKSDISDTKLINNRYAFIADYKDNVGLINLYDLKDNKSVAMYKSVKNYGVGINNNYYIVAGVTGKYGVIEISNSEVKTILPFTYDFIGLQNDIDLETNKISADTFIVKKDNTWFLTDVNEAIFTEKMLNPIVDFDTKTFITKNDNYNLYNYNGTFRLNGSYKYLNYISKYIEVKDINNNYYILDGNTLSIVSNTFATNDESVIETTVNSDNKLEIKIDNEVKQTIDIL